MKLVDIIDELVAAKITMEERRVPTVVSMDVIVLYRLVKELAEHVKAQEPEQLTEEDVLAERALEYGCSMEDIKKGNPDGNQV